MQEIAFSVAPGFPILSLTIFAPLVAAVFAALLRDPRRARQVALAGTATSLALSVVALMSFRCCRPANGRAAFVAAIPRGGLCPGP
jgi:NADH:ubiquinone oxidoreductase subunit 4 (subunit M)